MRKEQITLNANEFMLVEWDLNAERDGESWFIKQRIRQSIVVDPLHANHPEHDVCRSLARIGLTHQDAGICTGWTVYDHLRRLTACSGRHGTTEEAFTFYIPTEGEQ